MFARGYSEGFREFAEYCDGRGIEANRRHFGFNIKIGLSVCISAVCIRMLLFIRMAIKAVSVHRNERSTAPRSHERMSLGFHI
jgi:hypothetical protein